MDAITLWKIRGSIVFANFATLAVFAGIGYAVDRFFETAPKALILMVLLSFPVANLLAIRLTKSRLAPAQSK